VASTGVGRGSGREFLGPRELGIPQVPPDLWDRIALEPLVVPGASAGPILTVAAASADAGEADARARTHGAWAEDMESFSVALACRRLSVRALVLRGISNRAGDADRARWRIEGATEALRVAVPAACEAVRRG
jgi:futalosine hydrolase